MQNKLKIDLHILFPFLLTLVLWVIFYFDKTQRLNLAEWGVVPRTVEGIPGIIAHFFVHGNFNHILSNTLSLLVLSLLMFIGYREIAFRVFALMLPMTGLLLWLGGRNMEEGNGIVHIGASGVIFSLFGFLLLSGFIRRNKIVMSITALVIFLYGYMVWGIFPLEKQISWDGHLAGLISGFALALVYRKKGPAPDKYELLEREEEEEDEYDKLPEEEKYWLQGSAETEKTEEKNSTEKNDQLFINYDFRPRDKKE